CEFWDRQC
ncbi:hypothetical protein VCHENC02_1520B, partial [Vibrio harveyi]